MRTYEDYDPLHAIALEQHGIFTASQAPRCQGSCRMAGVNPVE